MTIDRLLALAAGLAAAAASHAATITVTDAAGQPLAVVDAMKMENVLRAERDGRVAKIRAAKGDSLAVDQSIIEFE